jgi:hypothetical protein
MNPFGGFLLAPFAESISQLSPGGNLVEIIGRDNIGDFFCLGIKLSIECVFWKAHKISLEIIERYRSNLLTRTQILDTENFKSPSPPLGKRN